MDDLAAHLSEESEPKEDIEQNLRWSEQSNEDHQRSETFEENDVRTQQSQNNGDFCKGEEEAQKLIVFRLPRQRESNQRYRKISIVYANKTFQDENLAPN